MPARALVAHAVIAWLAMPFAMPAKERGGDCRGAGLDDCLGLVRLRADDGRHPGFQDAGFLAGDGTDRVAEKRLMVERDRGDRGRRWAAHDIGRVEPAAKPG